MPINDPIKEIAELKEQLSEMASNMDAVMKENEQLTKLVTSDTQLADLIKQIKSKDEEIALLRERNAGLMSEKNAAIRAARAAQKRAAK